MQVFRFGGLIICATLCLALAGCGFGTGEAAKGESTAKKPARVSDATAGSDEEQTTEVTDEPSSPTAAQLREKLGITESYFEDFDHGEKGVDFQRYIVLHDTESTSPPAEVLSWWKSNGNRVSSHFIVGRDGSVLQCVPLDRIAHHAGYGDTGHNDLYGITEDGRDDMIGSTPVGDWAADYGMNAWSVGIEIVHVGGGEAYTEEQLAALDGLIAYIDAYYAEKGQKSPSAIIDHKAWRSGNSDTSPEFATYLANYQDHRTHGAAA